MDLVNLLLIDFGKLTWSHSVKTWFGHDCPPLLAWVSHSYITSPPALHAGISYNKEPRPSVMGRGSSWRKQVAFLSLSGCDGRCKLGGFLKAGLLCQSWMQPKSPSCFFLFHLLEGELGPTKLDDSGILKRIWWFMTQIHVSAFQFFYLIVINYCTYLHLHLSVYFILKFNQRYRLASHALVMQLHPLWALYRNFCRKSWHVWGNDMWCDRIRSSLHCSISLPSLTSLWEPMCVSCCWCTLSETNF